MQADFYPKSVDSLRESTSQVVSSQEMRVMGQLFHPII